MKCPNCGVEVRDDATFCPECGAKIEHNTAAQSNSQSQPNMSQPNMNQSNMNQSNMGQPYMGQQNMGQQYYGAPMQISAEYTPISMWGYFGYEILFSIPIVGFIFLLIYAFGGTPNKNLKNFARSYFCLVIIVLILVFIIASVVGIGAASALGGY